MPVLEAIERDIRLLPREEARELQDWLADYLDDQEELSLDFAAAIDRGKRDLEEGRSRVLRPANA